MSMNDSRLLIVGLGNPGAQYVQTRHNIGFMVIDQIAASAGIAIDKTKFNSKMGTGRLAGQNVVLLKPQTFMNRSGQSVTAASQFYRTDPKNILVIHDELDLPFGTVKLKAGGGHAGHNGLRSIGQLMGTLDFIRLRFGIGRPVHGQVSNYVLARFHAGEETDWLPQYIDDAVAAIEIVLRKGVQMAMNEVNAPPR